MGSFSIVLIHFSHLAFSRAHSRASGSRRFFPFFLPVSFNQNGDGLQFLPLQASIDSGQIFLYLFLEVVDDIL